MAGYLRISFSCIRKGFDKLRGLHHKSFLINNQVSLQPERLYFTITICHLLLEVNNRENKVLFFHLYQVLVLPLVLSVACVVLFSGGGGDVSLHIRIITEMGNNVCCSRYAAFECPLFPHIAHHCCG